MTDRPLLGIKDLAIHYETNDGVVKTLNGVSIYIDVRETLGLVGETGAGKTTLAKGIARLISDPPDKILGKGAIFEEQDLLKLSANGVEAIRGRGISIMFQDPMTFLNPVLTVGEQITEVIENRNTSLSRQETRKWVENIPERVGIPAGRFGEYPRQFSGGTKQRAVVAITLACNPKLLTADEPTMALNVTTQIQVLEMIYKLKSENNASMILITCDLGVVARNCDYVTTIYVGEVAKCGTLREIYKDIKHPYTEGFSGPIPSLTSDIKRLQAIDGMMPDPTKSPEGCVFCERYKYAVPECPKTHPGMVTVGGTHQVRRIRYH